MCLSWLWVAGILVETLMLLFGAVLTMRWSLDVKMN